MTRQELEEIKRKKVYAKDYQLSHWSTYNYKHLSNIMYIRRAGRADHDSYNDCIIMADTETSKSKYDKRDSEGRYIRNDNYIVAFTVSIRAYDRNICTLYGNKGSELMQCLDRIIQAMHGDKIIIYFHNLSYDWVFIRKFMFDEFGKPIRQLNTKPQYPIYIEFENGLILRDSLILAQKSLDKWGNDLDVEHKKASGKWDYDKIRHQVHNFTAEELEYIEHDTLCGVECLDKLRKQLNKHVYNIPFTATGIPREECRKRGKGNHARERFLSQALDFRQYMKILNAFHGGFTHGNRHFLDWVIEHVIAYDFSSSYPFVMLSEKFPCEKFTSIECDYHYILDNMNEYAFIFKLTLLRPRLKDDRFAMPPLQASKCIRSVNPICDNGRVLCADYIEIYLTEMDFDVIQRFYDWDDIRVEDVESAYKKYLPRWFTDYIYELYYDKCTLKNKDPLSYILQKAKLNSTYGMCCQRSLRSDAIEDYDTGEYHIENKINEEEYEKYLNNHNNILSYQHGVYVTAYAFHNIFSLGECVDYKNGGEWLYTDTDSCYATKWDGDKLAAYNQNCIDKLKANGYGPVEYEGKTYNLGVAELDGVYSEFRYLGAKRYCCRDEETGKLKITVAGVPKKGVETLHDNIANFKDGIIFDGKTSGKMLHTLNIVEEIYKNEYGDEIGDSINLSPCDYLMTSVKDVNWIESFFYKDIEVQTYESE